METPDCAVAIHMCAQRAESHPLLFAGGLAGSTPIRKLEPSTWRQQLNEEGTVPIQWSLQIRVPPAYFFTDHDEALFWLKAGAHLERRADTYVVDLNSGLSMTSRRRRALAKAEHLRTFVVERADDSEILHWQMVEYFYQQRRLSLSVDLNRLRLLVSTNPDLFEVLVCTDENSSAPAAVALLVWAGESLRLPIYVSDPKAFPGATERLVYIAAGMAVARGRSALDLGSSIDQATGVPSLGIATFKQEFGATPRSNHLAKFTPEVDGS